MAGHRQGFEWVVDERKAWPPSRRPQPPFGPSSVEVIRSCALRACFEVTGGYERRLGFAARVGTALHRVLQSFSETPFPDLSPDKVAEEAQRRFQAELRAQEAVASGRPRERSLPRDPDRVSRAQMALTSEALRLLRGGELLTGHRALRAMTATSVAEAPSAAEGVEIPVGSRDGLFSGRVDRAERTAEGTRLVDYKSALRDDLPERYERQLQLYAFMWNEAHGEWPVEGQVIYPMTGDVRLVAMEPETCRRVAAESARVVERLSGETSVVELATPGDVCKVCEFRPWCRPFWTWQAREPSHIVALERATMGFEGQITKIDLVNHYWKVAVTWRRCPVKIVAPEERFPQLKQARMGTQVRALEMRLHGLQLQPQATVGDFSEIFLVRNL